MPVGAFLREQCMLNTLQCTGSSALSQSRARRDKATVGRRQRQQVQRGPVDPTDLEMFATLGSPSVTTVTRSINARDSSRALRPRFKIAVSRRPTTTSTIKPSSYGM